MVLELLGSYSSTGDNLKASSRFKFRRLKFEDIFLVERMLDFSFPLRISECGSFISLLLSFFRCLVFVPSRRISIYDRLLL